MKVLDLRRGLQLYSQSLEHWGAKAADLNDLNTFIEMLGEHDDLSVANLCAKLSDRKADLKATLAKKSSTKTKVDPGLVEAYLARFGAETSSRSGQLAIADELANDKRAKLPEIIAIANALTESGVSYSKKPLALEALRTWINRRFDTERRLDGTSGIF